MHEVLRAVDRVDDPRRAVAEPRDRARGRGGLLADDGVRGERSAQRALDARLVVAVGLRARVDAAGVLPVDAAGREPGLLARGRVEDREPALARDRRGDAQLAPPAPRNARELQRGAAPRVHARDRERDERGRE